MIIPISSKNCIRVYKKISIKVENDSITLTTSYEDGSSATYTITLDTIKKHRGFFDGTMLGITVDGNLMALRGSTLNNREQAFMYIYNADRPQFACVIIIPDKGASLDEYLICPLCATTDDLDPTLVPLCMTCTDFNTTTRNLYMPQFVIEGSDTMSKDSTIELKVKTYYGTGKVYPRPIEIYLENVNGYLPKTRVISNGESEGTFKVMSLGLDKGDTIKVKVGFRNFPGKTEKVVTIV